MRCAACFTGVVFALSGILSAGDPPIAFGGFEPEVMRSVGGLEREPLQVQRSDEGFEHPASSGVLYAVRETDNFLVSIDIDTLGMTEIGALTINFDFGGLAYDGNSGTLWMIGGRPRQDVFTVDMTTGAATWVGEHGVSDMFGLAFDTSTDTLYGVTFTGGGDLYELSQTDGSATLVGSGFNRIGGLAYDSKVDRLVGIADGAGDLYEINRNTGAQTLIYPGPANNDSGLAYDGVNNYFWDIDWSGNLYYYDIDNGFDRTTVLSGLGQFDGLAWVGFVRDCLTLEVSELQAGSAASWSVSGATPNTQVAIVYGHQSGETFVNGFAGYCADFGIRGVNQNRLICAKASDGAGNLSCKKTIPSGAGGLHVLSQAAERDTCPDVCMSNLDDQVVQ